MQLRTLVPFALLALLPLLASAAGMATVRVTNGGAVPITVAGQTIRPSATASIPVPAGEAGTFVATAPDGWGFRDPVAYPVLRDRGVFALRATPIRGAPAVARPSAPEATSEPEATLEPDVTSEPEVASEPDVSPEPEVASEPEVAYESDVSPAPSAEDEIDISAVDVLAGRFERAADIEAICRKEILLGGEVVDFVVCNDDVAVLFAVYPEEGDDVGGGREDDPAGEGFPAKLDVMVAQRELLSNMETNAEIHLAVIAGSNILAGIGEAWREKLEGNGVELVEDRDFEDYLRKLFPATCVDEVAEEDGTANDTAEDFGFGRSVSNPVRFVEVDAEYAYLRRLRNPAGKIVRALRWGSFYVDGFEGPMDRWSVERAPDEYVDIYFYPYDFGNSLVAPDGFSLDMDGIEEEFSRFSFHPPAPRAVNEPEEDDEEVVPNGADDAESVRLETVVLPPPGGFVNLLSRPELFDQYRRFVPAENLNLIDAAFGKTADFQTLEGVASVDDSGNGKYIPLSVFQLTMSEMRAHLFDSGIDAGTFAPHRITPRSLQWTRTKLFYRGGRRGIAIFSNGVVWIRGHALSLSGPILEMPLENFRMNQVERSRRWLETWEDEILRANGIDPETAGQTDVLEAEEARSVIEALIEGKFDSGQ